MIVKGKTVLITGGSSEGMGEATAREMVKQGAKVAVFDINDEGGKRLQEELGDSLLYLHVDVSDADAVHDAVEKVVESFGSVDVAITCAATEHVEKFYSRSRGLCGLEGYRKIMRVNLDGTFYVIREAVGQMVKNEPNEEGERGVVIMTSSCSARDGISGQVPYAASKSALFGMLLPLARELSVVGIRVASITPGPFDTAIFRRGNDKWKERTCNGIPFPKRAGRPEEYAMLADSIIKNPFINGADYMIDGAFRQPY